MRCFFCRLLSMALRKHFPSHVLDTLFDAILIDDVVDPGVMLPSTRPTDFPVTQITECFYLCRQLWLEGISYSQLIKLVNNVIKNKDLSDDERLSYKYIRAKYKHMGFAFILYTSRHKRPFLYEATSTLMGEVQDAFRNALPRKTVFMAKLLKFILSKPFEYLRQKSVKNALLDTEDFSTALKKDIEKIPQYLQKPNITPSEFHSIRKIISRHVSFFDTLRTLYPCEDYYKMSRFLSAINGLMGIAHDIFVEQASFGKLDYKKDKIIIPSEIAIFLKDLCAFYDVSYKK